MSIISDSSSSSVALPSGSVSSGVRESLLEVLINISQCSDSRCSNNSCLEFKKSVQSLEATLKKGPAHLDPEDADTLRLLHEHYTDPCGLPNCRVPWCRFMSYRCLRSQDSTLQELRTLLNHPMLTLLPRETTFDEFIKLDPEFTSEVAVEWEDWLVISPLSHSHTVALAAPLSLQGHTSHWVVKMASLQDDDNQLQMLRKLRGLQHPHIISHIWAASSDIHHVLVICTQYLPGLSVKDMLEKRHQLSYRRTSLFFLQVLSATQRLHELDIIFLNWKCSNLLLDVKEQTLKVSNFATSVDLSSDNADFGTIKLTLPADLVPAEILQNEPLSHKTDSWGLACIAHEMMTGVRPWYHLRHENLGHIQRQILMEAPPGVSRTLPKSVQILIQTCLQKSPESRLSVREMIEYLHAELD